MLLGFQFSLAIICTKCKTKFHITELKKMQTCYHCKQEVDISPVDQGYKIRNLAYTHLALDIEKKSGSGFVLATAEKLKGTYVYQVQEPSCAKCELPYNEDNVKTANNEIKCGHCNSTSAIKQNDKVTKEMIDPDLDLWIINEEKAETTEEESEKKEDQKSLLMGCMSCGSGLSIDGSNRTVTCEYCKNENYLPLEVWTSAKEVQKEHSLFFAINVTDEQLLRAKIYCLFTRNSYNLEDNSPYAIGQDYDRESHMIPLEKEIKELLIKLGPETWDEYVDCEHPKVLSLLSEMDGVSEKFKTSLIKGKKIGIREEFAKDENTSDFIRTFLTKDKSDRIRIELAKNQTTNAAILAVLSADKNAEVRRKVARNENSSSETIKLLRKDSVKDVSNDAQRNQNYKPGFFERVFGS